MSTEAGAAPPAASGRRRSFTVYLWGVGILVYVVCVSIIGWGRLRHAIAGVDVPLFGVMAAVTVGALWVRVVKWRIVLGKGQRAVGLFFISKAAGEWSPGRLGELSPLLIRQYRTARMGAWIIVDRILEMGVTLALGIFGLAAVNVPNRAFMAALAAALGVTLLGGLYLLTRQGLFARMKERLREGSLPYRAVSGLASMSGEVAALRKSAWATGSITVLAGCLDVWAGVLLYACFGWHVSFALMATAKGVHAVTSAVPLTPNATGIPYLTTAILIHEAGGVPSEVLAAAVALSVLLTNLIFWSSLGLGAAGWRRQDETPTSSSPG